MSTVTKPENTVLMFSCAQCHAHQSLGEPPLGVTIQEVADSNGIFHTYMLQVGLQVRHVDQGYYGFSPERSIFSLTPQEVESYFGVHVCQKTSSSESKAAPAPQELPVKKHTRKTGVVVESDSAGHLRLKRQLNKYDSL